MNITRSMVIASLASLAPCVVAVGGASADSTSRALHASPAAAPTTTGAQPPAPTAPGVLVPVDVGVQPVNQYLIDTYTHPPFADQTTTLVDHGFAAVGQFPNIANSLLFRLDATYYAPRSDEGSLQVSSYTAVVGTVDNLQPIVDTLLAAVAPDPSQYEVVYGGGVDGVHTVVELEATSVNYDANLPDWSIKADYNTDFPGTLFVVVTRWQYLATPVSVPATIAVPRSAELAAFANAGLGEPTHFSFESGLNNFMGGESDGQSVFYHVAGATDAAANTACGALGVTATADSSEPGTYACDAGLADGTGASVEVEADFDDPSISRVDVYFHP